MSMAAETGPGHPTNRKLGVVILGASTYPQFPSTRKLDNESFARSAAAFRSLMADEGATVFGKPEILDLFDASDDPTAIIRQVIKFLKSAPALTAVLFYYCGHGDLLRDRTFYLTLKATEPEHEASTGLMMQQMMLGLETQLVTKRVFLVFDCCYAAEAAQEWMKTKIGSVGLIAASSRDDGLSHRRESPSLCSPARSSIRSRLG